MKKKCKVKGIGKRLYQGGGGLNPVEMGNAMHNMSSRGISASNFDLNSLMLNQANVSPELAAMNTNISSQVGGGMNMGFGGAPMTMVGQGMKSITANRDDIIMQLSGMSPEQLADYKGRNYTATGDMKTATDYMGVVGSAVSGDIGGAVSGLSDMVGGWRQEQSDIESISGFTDAEKRKLKFHNTVDRVLPTMGLIGQGLSKVIGPGKLGGEFEDIMTDRYNRGKRAEAIGARNKSLGISNQLNFKALGGSLNTKPSIDTTVEKLNPSLKLIKFDEGKSHRVNPNGGIPQGINQLDGSINMVEQGETRFGDYIFSDKLKLTNQDVDSIGNGVKGKTFAKASKKLYNEVEERPNDPIAKRTWIKNVGKLIAGNEAAKTK